MAERTPREFVASPRVLPRTTVRDGAMGLRHGSRPGEAGPGIDRRGRGWVGEQMLEGSSTRLISALLIS
jgi:hypothetical protein